mgnify:CR=1 FL=1
MKIYLIHFGKPAAGQDRRFSLFEAKESGAQCLIFARGAHRNAWARR